MAPEIIAAWFTGVATLITAVASLLVSLRTKRIQFKDSKENAKQLQEIHVLVNSRLSMALEEVASLKQAMAVTTDAAKEKELAK